MEEMQAIWNPSSFRLMGWAAPPLSKSKQFASNAQPSRANTEPYIAARAMEGLSLVSIWWSAQTAVWIACGLGGLVLVFLNWLLLSRIAPLLPRLTERAPAGSLPELPPDSEFAACKAGQTSQVSL